MKVISDHIYMIMMKCNKCSWICTFLNFVEKGDRGVIWKHMSVYVSASLKSWCSNFNLYTYDHICREGPRRWGAVVYICLNSKEPSSSHLVSNNLINWFVLQMSVNLMTWHSLFLKKKSIIHVSPSSSMLHSLINQLREVGMTFD